MKKDASCKSDYLCKAFTRVKLTFCVKVILVQNCLRLKLTTRAELTPEKNLTRAKVTSYVSKLLCKTDLSQFLIFADT